MFDRMLESNDPRDTELATLRARVAVQDAEIARLREALEAIKRADTHDIIRHGYECVGQRLGSFARVATTTLEANNG